MDTHPLIYTIGHSNHFTEEFIALLKQNGITCIADIRITPYSKYVSQYNRERLAPRLKKDGIAYVYLGAEFGEILRDFSIFNEAGFIDFEKVTCNPRFLRGIERLKSGLKKGYKISLMCAEKNPAECHRGVLISPNLESAGFSVRHITPEGETFSHHDIEKRLVKRYCPEYTSGQIEIFRSGDWEAVTREAYQKRLFEMGLSLH